MRGDKKMTLGEHADDFYFLIEGGLYSETAMREAKSKNTVYSLSNLVRYARDPPGLFGFVTPTNPPVS